MKRTILLLLTITIRLSAQNDTTDFQKILNEDSTTLSILFSYPDSIRNAILIASTYPQGFVKLDKIQNKTSSDFKEAISKYTRSRQKQLWELTRYPALIPELLKSQNKNKIELNEQLKNYPEKIKNAAIYFTRKDYALLIKIDQIHKEFNNEYQDAIKDFPPEVQYSFRKLLQTPELVKHLSENIKTTMTIGDIYKRSPDMVKQKTDTFHDNLVKNNNLEYQEWKKGIIQDADVQNELKKIARKYERADEYQDDIYSNQDYNTTASPVYPYPYWAGYLYWMGRAYWYPYPWWYNSGFYFYPNGNMFFIGMPTYHFGYWYYGHRHYPHHYPRTDNYFHNHVDRYRGSHQGFNQSVRNSKVVTRRRK